MPYKDPAANAAWQRRDRAKRKAKGVCTQCQRPTSKTNGELCEKHRTQKCEATRAWRAKRPS